MAGAAAESATFPLLGAVVDPLLQDLARLEGQHAAGVDSDRLAVLRIAPAARMFLIDQEGAEAGDFHFLTLAQRIPDDREHRFDHFTGSLLRGAYPLVDQIYKIGFSHALRRNDPHPLALGTLLLPQLRAQTHPRLLDQHSVNAVYLLIGQRAILCTITTSQRNALLSGRHRGPLVDVEHLDALQQRRATFPNSSEYHIRREIPIQHQRQVAPDSGKFWRRLESFARRETIGNETTQVKFKDRARFVQIKPHRFSRMQLAD